MRELKDFPITHGYVNPVTEPNLGVQVNGQSAVRYMRFLRSSRIHHLELKRAVYGRWTPNVPTHPAHLKISVLDRESLSWKLVKEVDLPYDPRTAGEGLRQSMTDEERDAHFASILDSPPYVIELDGLVTDHLRVECDREHPVYPSHGEVNGNIIHVPFGILNPLKAYGEVVDGRLETTEYHPLLRQGELRPSAPKGMKIKLHPERVTFEGRHLSIGFSLRRPVLLHMGWDALGKRASENRHFLKYSNDVRFGGPSGPTLRTLNQEYVGRLWTGDVSVEGNKVIYRNLQAVDGLTLDAVFTVEGERVLLEIVQRCDRPIPALEYDCWRWMWDEAVGITAAAAEPTLLPGRNGDVKLPFMWATDGVGCLSCRLAAGDPAHVRTQIESYKAPGGVVTGGVALVDRAAPDACLVIPAGVRSATIELAVSNFEPASNTDGRKLSPGILRQWSTMFSCFRPEFGGFSNNAISNNCLPSVEYGALIAVNTRRPQAGPDPVELARFTAERAILMGGGYNYWRNLYGDSDPMIISGAGQVHNARPSLKWLRKIEPGLKAAVERMASSIGKEGLVTCRDLSGNSGSYRWSSNCMDVVGFGHVDGFVNAFAYRAFRNASALFAALGRKDDARRCRELAGDIRASYAAQLLNPETGWVAGWRSRDGQLHDYAFPYVNGPAIAFGLLDDQAAHKALAGLERLRSELGISNARMGLPPNLLPIRKEDHVYWRIRGEILPTFETYTDGAMMGCNVTYYLRALSLYGFKREAREMAKSFDEGMAEGLHSGGHGAGVEFRSWDGLPNGYEGTLIWEFGSLYAVAIELGMLKPPEPEWWPAD